MKKIFHVFLSLLIALSACPFNIRASEIIHTPPIFVNTFNLNKEVAQLKNQVTNQERVNRDEEIAIRQLAEDNSQLIRRLEAMQHFPESQRPSKDFVDTMKALSHVMDEYGRQLDERNRRLMARNEETIKLRQRIEQLEKGFYDIADLNQSVENTKLASMLAKNSQQLIDYKEQLAAAKEQLRLVSDSYEKLLGSAPSVLKNETAPIIVQSSHQELAEYKIKLASTKAELDRVNGLYQGLLASSTQSKASHLDVQLNDQKEELLFKDAHLSKKYQQLLDFKAQLATTKEELKKAQDLYQSQGISAAQREKELNAIIDSLRSQTSNLQDDQNALQQKDARIAQLENQILDKDKEIAQLKTELMDMVNLLRKAREELLSKDKIIANQNQSIESLRQDLQQMQQNMDGLKQHYVDYDGGFAQIQAKIVALKEKLAATQARAADADVQEKDLIKLKGEIAALNYQLETSKQDINEYQGQIITLNTTIKELNAQLSSQGHDLQDKTKNIEELKNQVTKLNENIRELNLQMDLKNKESQDKAIQLDQLQAKLKEYSNYKDAIKALQEQVIALTNQSQAFKMQVAEFLNIRERLNLYESLFVRYRHFNELTAQKIELLTQLANSNKSKEDSYKEQLKRTISYWEGLNKNNNDQLQGLKVEMSDKQSQIILLQKHLEESKAQVEQLGNMLDVYQKKMDSKDADFTSKVKEIDELQAQLQIAQENLAQREDDLKKVQEYFFALEQKSSAKNLELKDKTQQLALMNITMEKQSQEVSVLTERLTVAEEKLKSSVSQEDLLKTRELLAAAASEMVSLKSSLKEKDASIDQLKKLTTDNDVRRQELDQAKAKVGALMEDLYFKDKQIERLKKQIADKDQGLNELVKKLEESDKNLRAATQKNDLAAIEKTLNEAQKQLVDLKDQLKEKQNLINRMQKSQEPVEALRNQLGKAKAQAQEAQGAVKDKNEQVQVLSLQIKNLNQEIRDLQTKIEKLQGSPVEDTQVMKAKMKQLTDDVKLQDKEILRLSNQLERKISEYDRQEKDMDRLRQELKNARKQTSQLDEGIQVIEKTRFETPGNEGYLIRNGKDTSIMIYEVNDQISVMEKKIQEISQESQEHKAQFEIARKELEQTRALLEKCQSKASAESLFPNTIPATDGLSNKNSFSLNGPTSGN